MEQEAQVGGALNPSADVEASATAAEPRRVLVGLVAGRLVNFKLNVLAADDEHPFERGGCLRPLLIVDAKDGTGLVTGVLFFNPQTDTEFLPDGVLASVGGATIVTVPYGDGDELPGAWSWPKRDAVVASAVDAGAIDTQFESMRSDLLGTVNAKLTDQATTVQKMLDEQSKMITQVLTDAGLVNTGNAQAVDKAAPAVGTGG